MKVTAIDSLIPLKQLYGTDRLGQKAGVIGSGEADKFENIFKSALA